MHGLVRVSDIGLVSQKSAPVTMDCACPEDIEFLVVVPLDENLIASLAVLRVF